MPQTSLTFSRLRAGLLTTLTGQFGLILIRIFEIPIFLAFWGISTAGEWFALQGTAAFMMLSDLGVSTFQSRHMARIKNGNDEVKTIFFTSVTWALCSSITLTALTIFLLTQMEIWNCLNFTNITGSNFTLILFAMSIQAIVQLINQLLFGTLNYVKRYPLGQALLFLSTIVPNLLVIAAVPFGASVKVVALIIITSSVLSILIAWSVQARAIPWLYQGRPRLDWKALLKVAGGSLAEASMPLGMALSYQFPRIVIAAFLGPVVVPVFVAHRQLLRFATLTLNFARPLSAELALNYHEGVDDKNTRFKEMAERFIQLLFWMCLIVFISIFIFGSWVFDVWTRHEIAFSIPLFLILAALTFTELLWRATLVPINMTNMHSPVAWTYIGSGILASILVVWFVPLFDLQGAASALILCEAATLYSALRVLSALLKESRWGLLKNIFRPPFWIFTYLKSFI